MQDIKTFTKNGSTSRQGSGQAKLTTKQLSVIEDLFAVEFDEKQVLEKHKISRRTYDKWMCDENFIKEFDRRMESARRQNDFLIARFANNAAIKLISLCNSETEETARKACLDIIGLLRPAVKQAESPPQDAAPDELSPELAGKLLKALADNENKTNQPVSEAKPVHEPVQVDGQIRRKI